MLAWTYVALPGIVAFLVAASIAVFLWRLDPSRLQNVRGAVVVGTFALIAATDGALRPLATDPEEARAAALAAAVGLTLLPVLMVRFIATIQTRLAVPLRIPAVRVALWLATLGAIGTWLARPEWVQLDPVLAGDGSVWLVAPARGLGIVLVVILAVALYGVFAARARAEAAKVPARHEQARGNALSLTIAGMLLFGGIVLWFVFPGARWFAEDATGVWSAHLFAAVGVASVSALFARAAIQNQVFDVRLKARGLVRQSTVVAVFTFVVITAGETLERIIPLPGVVIGIAAAVVLGLLFRRLQELASRLAERLVPDPLGATGLRYSNVQVYRSAIATAFGDGEISAKELKTLRTLRTQLGVDDASAERIEQEVREEMRQKR